MSLFDLPPLPHYFSSEHEQFRHGLRQFIAAEITPHVNDRDEAGSFPLSLYRKAADIGLLGLGYPEQYGGTPGDVFYKLIVAEEFARCGSGGVQASLNSHTIGLPPVVAAGAEELKRRVIPQVIAGEKISALAVTTAEMFMRQEAIAGPVLASADAKEGAAAFAEKRAPRWSGS